MSAVACWLHQTQASEDTRGGRFGEERWSVYLPADTALDIDDRVSVDGVVYEVAGPPWSAVNPRTGIVEFVQASLRKAG